MPNAGHGSQRIDNFRDQRWLIDLAERQDGLVTVGQLAELGVYAVGHRALSSRGWHRAALLSAGEDAALGHSSVLRHGDIADLRDRRIHVIVPRGSCAPRREFALHRTVLLDERDVTVIDGLRCTTVARALIDLASITDEATLAYACRKVEYARQLDVTAIGHTLARMKRPPGVAALRRVLAPAGIEGAITETRLEQRGLVALMGVGMSVPLLQHPFDLRPDHRPVRVDFWYPDAQLVVEIDGPHHALPLQRALDEQRDAAFARRAIEVFRITDRELDADPAEAAGRAYQRWSQLSPYR
jgi:hypothetical protein